MLSARADVLRWAEGHIAAPEWRRSRDLAGVEARGMPASGLPGNPGGFVVSILKTAGKRTPAHPLPKAVDVAPDVRRSEAAGARMVPPREGNEALGGWAARNRSVS